MSSSPSGSLLRAFLEKRGGAAPWRDWMEAALYDPDNGYYTRNVRTVGRRGDFSTSATLSETSALAIAAWVQEEWRLAKRKLPLIEAGPGDGSLHGAVLRKLGLTGRMGLRSHLVESSPVLRDMQQKGLQHFQRRLAWHGSMESALQQCDGGALIFSNELADAFPAHVLEWSGGYWLEVWLNIEPGGAIVESLRPVSSGITSSSFAINWPDAQRIEVHHSWRKWLEQWRPLWKKGAMLTIDYGGAPADIYLRRPRGTVRGYFHHQRLEAAELYPLMGRCDITADVNFTDLREWGETAGLTTVKCISKREFAGGYADPREPFYEAGGGAEAFQCLLQRV